MFRSFLQFKTRRFFSYQRLIRKRPILTIGTLILSVPLGIWSYQMYHTYQTLQSLPPLVSNCLLEADTLFEQKKYAEAEIQLLKGKFKLRIND